MRCPSCSAAELRHETRALPYTYNGVRTSVRGVTGAFCLACGEGVLDAPESARVSREMVAFSRVVDNSLAVPGGG
jgi:HTH-type transcriptional regulator/antitoxin MqsA